MMPAPSPQSTPQPQRSLTKRDLAILQDVPLFRVVSAKDIALRHFSPRSLTHVRELLNRLTAEEYLFQFVPPRTTSGNPERVYALGSKGARVLTETLGIPVTWYCDPYELKSFSYSTLRHCLFLTRIIAALTYFARTHPQYSLRDCRLCYELARMRMPPTGEDNEKPQSLPVIADAWVRLRRSDGQGIVWWIEADCGSEMRKKFQAGLKARITFLESGDYARVFGTRAVVMCYLTTGQLEAYKDHRRKALQAWTQAILVEMKIEDWADLFQFAAVGYMELFTSSIFDAPIWYPADSQTPAPLLPDFPTHITEEKNHGHKDTSDNSETNA